MNDVAISIIVPVYNTEKFLRECLDSLINQSFRNIEIICVNDGSKDNSAEILKEYENVDQRIVVIKQENAGLSSARNTGLEHCRSKYVMFVDSDDWMDTDVCENAYDAIEREKTDLVFWSYTREYQERSFQKLILGPESIRFEGESFFDLYRRLYGLVGEELRYPENGDNLVTAWGKLYRKELLEDIRFIDTKIIGTEDSIFNISAFSKMSSAYYLPLCGYHYRKYNSNSLTTVYNDQLFVRWQRMHAYMQQMICENKLPAVFSEALSNRRALALIALSLNIVAFRGNIHQKVQMINQIIQAKEYKNAFVNLDTSFMPVHWKLFFREAKAGHAGMVLLLAEMMQMLRKVR